MGLGETKSRTKSRRAKRRRRGAGVGLIGCLITLCMACCNKSDDGDAVKEFSNSEHDDGDSNKQNETGRDENDDLAMVEA